MVLQYYVLFDLFYAGDHTRCAPIKDIIVILMCIDSYDELHCWKNTINIIIESNRYLNLTINDVYPLLSVPFAWNLSCFSR